MNAIKLFPHPRPRALYIWRAKRGKTAPKALLRTVLAAMAEAAYRVNVSTRYVLMHMNAAIIPMPTKSVPKSGTAHWM